MNLERRRRQFIDGLRAVANFYEENPTAYYDGMHLTINMYAGGSTARQVLARTARAFGQCEKTYDGTNITVARQFSAQVTLAVFAPRIRIFRPIDWTDDSIQERNPE
jgi:hypothetical protein